MFKLIEQPCAIANCMSEKDTKLPYYYGCSAEMFLHKRSSGTKQQYCHKNKTVYEYL